MAKHTVTLIPGDGIGTETTAAMQRVVAAAGADIEWEIAEAGAHLMEEFGTPLPPSTIDAVRKNKVAIKGPVTTPVGTGFRSVNVALRQALDLNVCLRPVLSIPGAGGRYEDVDEAVAQYSHGALEHVTLYSLLEDPMTSCGCFECICGIEPCSMGVVITCREYAGITPLGMTFSEMASMTGGGVQTPGFMGHGKHYIASHKFLKAEGGVGRLVWLPKELKDQIRDKLNETAKDMYDIDNFADMVADETNCPNGDPEELLAFLSEVGHPVLSMDPLDI